MVFATLFLTLVVDQTIGFGSDFKQLTLTLVISTISGSLIACLLLFASLKAAKSLYLETAFAQRHVSIALTTYALATLFSFWVSALLINANGFTNHSEGFAVEASEQILSYFVMLGLFIVNAESEDYREQLRALLQVEQSLKNAKATGLAALDTERDSVVKETSSAIETALNQMSETDPEIASQGLSEASEELVRPMSHYLMQDRTVAKIDTLDDLPQMRWGDILEQLTVKPLMQPTLIAILSTFYVSRTGFDFAGQDLDANLIQKSALIAVYLVITCVTFFALSWVMQRLTKRPLESTKSPGVRWLIQGSAILAIAVPGHVILDGVKGILRLSSEQHVYFSDALNFLIPLAMAVLPYSLFQFSYLRSEAVLAELETRRNQLKRVVSRINEKLWHQRRQLAKVMHGPLQAALVAGAIQIHNSAKDKSKLNEIFVEVRKNVSGILSELRLPEKKGFAFDAELGQIKSTWSGVCRVELECEPNLWKQILEDSACQQALLDIIGEAASNAVIHGKATLVNVSLAQTNNQLLEVTVTDNGTPEAQSSTPGLGQHLFDHLCVSWSRQLSNSGAKFICTLPLSDN